MLVPSLLLLKDFNISIFRLFLDILLSLNLIFHEDSRLQLDLFYVGTFQRLMPILREKLKALIIDFNEQRR
jgi:hypothetical protein